MTTFKTHIDAMKYREQECRNKADMLMVQAETIQRERMDLELFIDREQAKEDAKNPK
jgi:hypothetical protein